MKLFIIFCCFLAFSESRFVKVAEDGSITVLTDNGKQIFISNPHGVKGERTIEVAGHDNEPIKQIKIDDDDVLGSVEVHSTKDRPARTLGDDAELLDSANKQKTALWRTILEEHPEDWVLWGNKHAHRLEIVAECVSSHDSKQSVYECLNIYEKRWEFIDWAEKLLNAKEEVVRKVAIQNCVVQKEGQAAVVECLKGFEEKVEKEMKVLEGGLKEIFGKCFTQVKNVPGESLEHCLHSKMMTILPMRFGSDGGVPWVHQKMVNPGGMDVEVPVDYYQRGPVHHVVVNA